MEPGEAEVSDIVIVLMEPDAGQIAQAVAGLKSAGVIVSDVDEENGIVEGTIETGKVAGLKKLPFVKCIRDVFDYVDDPCKPAKGEDVLPEEADDAGR